MKSPAIVAALAALITTDAGAQTLMDTECRDYRERISINSKTIERPEAPYCATSFGPFDEFSFETCKRDMEEYQRKVEGFSECLVAENKRAVSEFNAAVRSFNRRASN